MQISYLNSNLFLFCSYLLDEGKQETATLTFYSGGEKKTEKEKEENIWRRSLQKLSRILRSLGLETFANLRRDSVSDSVNFVSVLALKNLVSEKKYQYRRIWCRFWFWKIQSLWRKKVSVWVSVKILVLSFRDPYTMEIMTQVLKPFWHYVIFSACMV